MTAARARRSILIFFGAVTLANITLFGQPESPNGFINFYDDVTVAGAPYNPSRPQNRPKPETKRVLIRENRRDTSKFCYVNYFCAAFSPPT